ncbi:MAG: O-antigen translocase [Lysobacteraceae bacterium]|nr:MAG: O-antigen translocase [Xanthomonadaceae bacterium]
MITRLRSAVSFDRIAGPLAAAAAHGSRMAVNLIVIKFIAVLVGPSGLGLLGNLMSAATMAALFAGGGILNGITKYVAEFAARPTDLERFLRSAAAYGMTVSAAVFLLCVVAANPLSRFLFGDRTMAWLMPILGLAHFLCFVGGGIVAIVNGQRQPKYFAIITITAYLGVIPVAFALIRFAGTTGAAIALLAVVASTAIPALWVAARIRLLGFLKPRACREDVNRLFRYTCITAVSSIAFPLTEILIRTRLSEQLGIATTGIWQGLARLSGAILGFYTVFLATSHMPRLSAIIDRREAGRAVIGTLRFVGPTFAVVALLVYLLRWLIVPLLFSAAFQPMEEVIGWQLLGDTLRVCSYAVAFLGVAKAALKIHIAAELTQCGLYLGFTLFALHAGLGLRGVAQAYALTYAIYFTLTLLALGKYVRG